MISRSYPVNISKKKILLLSIPVFFSNIAIPLVSIVDTALMGNLGEVKYLAATSIAASVMSMIIWSFGFLRMGTVGLVSQLYSKSDYREIIKTLLRNSLFAIAIALILISIKPLLLILINKFFGVSEETQELIRIYVSVRLFSTLPEFLIYIMIGFYLGLGRTNISSLIVILFSSLNIVISSYFVLSLNLNIFGVALGTLLSALISSIAFLIFTYNFIKKKFQIIPKFERLLSFSKILKLFKINFDIFIRTLFLTFAFLWIPYLGSKLGEDFLAVNAVLLQFVMMASFFLDAYAYSTEGIVGFNIGKKNKKSFLLAVKNSIILSFFTGLIISLIYILFFKQIINLITDIEIIRFISYQHIIWVILIPPIASLCYQLDGIYVGAIQTKEMRNCMIISVIFFLLISTYLIKIIDNHGLWLSVILFMLARSLTLTFYFNRILKKF